ncbi:MAG: cytochrome C oxidase subunit IV family protein [Chloroflexi bacterium]|nr:cytochrome C oxidase subunit IV family protein [Chloroflexota bacterium]MCC6892079.1 cytochrome C oxidase subunit IV family protein [Anaerolineae bacterium]
MTEVTHDTETHIVDAHEQEHYDEKFSFVGRTFNVPTYTGVFALLGGLTVIEVLLSRLEHSSIITIIMLALAVFKAGLVVWFYMHLNKDNRIFLATLLIPVVLVILAVLFLSIVPVGGYS